MSTKFLILHNQILKVDQTSQTSKLMHWTGVCGSQLSSIPGHLMSWYVSAATQYFRRWGRDGKTLLKYCNRLMDIPGDARRAIIQSLRMFGISFKLSIDSRHVLSAPQTLAGRGVTQPRGGERGQEVYKIHRSGETYKHVKMDQSWTTISQF